MDKAAKLRELHELKTKGLLTENEFAAEKNKILNEDDSPNIMIPPSMPPSMRPPSMPPPQQGSGAGKIVGIIAVVLVVIVVIGVIVAAVMYVWAASFLEQGESAPIATFFVEESSSGIYYVNVIKVSKQEDLAGFSYFLKDESGSTYVGGNGFGEVAMQIVGGQEHGIDTSYAGSNTQLQSRTDNISADDGTDYPVHFSDNDRDGKLSAGDQFEIYGNGNEANGPADNNWKLDIQFDASGDIIGSARML